MKSYSKVVYECVDSKYVFIVHVAAWKMYRDSFN